MRSGSSAETRPGSQKAGASPLDHRPIGVFDSGLGGLTAVKKLREVMPEESIVYFGDTGRVPYGTKGRETILRYARQDMQFLLSKNVKLLVAACGTVSSMMTDAMAAALPAPFLSVIQPAARRAAACSKTGRIGVLGTAATVRSGSYAAALRSLRPDAEVISAACPMFVPLVENGCCEHPAARLFAAEYVQPLLAAGVDAVILGCTHYPLLLPVLRELFGPDCALIDPGAETALAARDLLTARGMRRLSGQGGISLFVSDLTDSFEPVAARFLQAPVEGRTETVRIDEYASTL